MSGCSSSPKKGIQLQAPSVAHKIAVAKSCPRVLLEEAPVVLKSVIRVAMCAHEDKKKPDGVLDSLFLPNSVGLQA